MLTPEIEARLGDVSSMLSVIALQLKPPNEDGKYLYLDQMIIGLKTTTELLEELKQDLAI